MIVNQNEPFAIISEHFRDSGVLLQHRIVPTTAGRLQIYALPKSTMRSTVSFYVQRGFSRAMAFSFTDCILVLGVSGENQSSNLASM
jgi:hypothetical protein